MKYWLQISGGLKEKALYNMYIIECGWSDCKSVSCCISGHVGVSGDSDRADGGPAVRVAGLL